ncbi:hypothetical protein JB92DRAFT_2981682, partial [Gautieria morchelliformis]
MTGTVTWGLTFLKFRIIYFAFATFCCALPIPQQKENHIYAVLRLFLSLLSPHPPLLPSPHQRSTMVSPTTLLHIPPLEPPTPHPFTSTSPSSRAPSPSRPPAQLQLRMQPAHRARCA